MQARSSSPEELAAWLRLAFEPGLGPVGARVLLAQFGLPDAVLSAGHRQLAGCMPDALARQLSGPALPAVQAQVDAALAWLEGGPQRSLLTWIDPDYPKRLFDLADPPLVLFAMGRTELAHGRTVGVVGSRHATAQGLDHAGQFASALASAGCTIVSGLALGVDAAAHEAALAHPASTIAIIGTGIDVVYPARHRALAHRMAVDGLILSEFALGTRALAWQFPKRNRLIAALSDGVLVVEAALASGSLITARQAGELGREVLAIPGSIHSPLARGCHRLIREGAKLVETASDVLDEVVRGTPNANGHGGGSTSIGPDRQPRRSLDTDGLRVGKATPVPRPSRENSLLPPGGDASAAPPPGSDPRRGNHTDPTPPGHVLSAHPNASNPNADTLHATDRADDALLQALGHDPLSLETLAHRTGQSVAQLGAGLLSLELQGVVMRLPGGEFQRRR